MTWNGTLTLNQCNGMVAKLRSLLWLGKDKQNKVPDMSVKMNMGDFFICKDYASQLKTKLQNLDAQLQQQNEIYEAIYSLRTLVVMANCNCGLNQCLSDINQLNDKIGLLKRISDQDGGYEDYIDRDFLDSVKVDGDTYSMDSLISSTRKISVLSANSLNEKIQSYQTQITALEQKRDALNNENTVEVQLPNGIAKLLALSK